MKKLYQDFLFPLKAGTRSLIALFALVYLAQVIGEKTKAYDLISWLAMDPRSVWSGQIWRLITYAFLTPSLALFVINILFIGMLGTWLERVWSPREWWGYCLLCTIGTAVAKLLITPSSLVSLISNVGMTFGLLVAWGRIFAHEDVLMMGFWKMTIRTAALIFGLINFLLVLPCAGSLNASILLSGGLIGWLYLSLRGKMVQLRSGRTVDSARIGRLEL